MERLTAQSVLLEERVRRLEEQTRQSSRTGSKPPSQDPPKTRQQRRAEARAKAKELLAEDRERRAAGGQSGDEGAGRSLAPEDQVDEFVDHYPDSCRGCGHEFGEDEKLPSRCLGGRQVAELLLVTVIVTEHRVAPFALPVLQPPDGRRLPGRGRRLGVRAEAAGRDRDADRAQLDLAP